MGRIHSIETFGTVDGPGVRFVVFFQGCPMRCLYCHNPDTWDASGGQEVTAAELMSRFLRNRSFYETGGITATGGEPMLQMEFLTELFSLAHEEGVHTCLDTSGILFPGVGYCSCVDAGTNNDSCTGAGDVSGIDSCTGARDVSGTDSGAGAGDGSGGMDSTDRLLSVTDLVMLDIKHIDGDSHRALTGHDNSRVLEFAKYLDKIQKPVWIRHVVVPGITFDKDELEGLGRFLATLSNVEKLEVLPYHSMGKVKYDALGMKYVLDGVPQLTKEEAAEAERVIRAAWRYNG